MDDAQPALRISTIVYGRENRARRVIYFVDALGNAGVKRIPDQVVLYRWRHRVFRDFKFEGTRLSPTVWRGVATTFPEGAALACALGLNGISERIALARPTLRSHKLSVPSAACLRAIFVALGPDRLKRLLDRHAGLTQEQKSGVPDLFLFAVDVRTDRLSFYRFVEVKKPKEPVRPDQRAEIGFLRSMGLNARVIRLIERRV